MLKTALCVILAVTAATAWQGLASVPSTADVQNGSAITYGNGKIWGIFPNEDDDCTYLMYYDLDHEGGPQWVYPGEDFDLDYLEHTAITFQWTYGGRFFVVGNDDGDADYPTLYTYDLVVIPGT